MNKNTQAFTIIELMVTVAIIAILSSIILANLTGAQLKARDAKRVSDIVQLQLALELYFDRCNQYPSLGAEFLPKLDASNGCPTISGTQVKFSDFTSKLPVPSTAGDYKYAVNNFSTPTDYVLQAKLEKPNQATKDDIDGSFTTYIFAPDNSAPSSGSASTLDCSDSATTSYFCVQPR